MNIKSVVDVFISLAKIDSPSGYESYFLEYLERIFHSIGFYTIYDNYGNLIIKSSEYNPGPNKPILFAFHGDKVSTGKKIIPVIRDNYLISKGHNSLGADNKASLAACIWTLMKHGERCPIEIVVTRMEEEGFIGARNLDVSMLTSDRGFIFDGDKIGDITTASCYWTELLIKNKNTKVRNIDQIIADVNSLHKVQKVSYHYNKYLHINLFSKQTRISSWISAFLEYIGKSYSYQIIRKCPGYHVTDREILQVAKNSLIKAGLEPKNIHTLIGNEACIYNSRGISMVNIGDGVENNHHFDEKIPVKNLTILSDIMQFILQSVSNKDCVGA